MIYSEVDESRIYSETPKDLISQIEGKLAKDKQVPEDFRKNGYKRRTLATVLANTYHVCKKVAEQRGIDLDSYLTEQANLGPQAPITASGVGPFLKFVFPTVKRLFPKALAHELVSVQPMTAPLGIVLFLRRTYNTTKGATPAGTEMIVNLDIDYTSSSDTERVTITGNTGSLTASWTPIVRGTVKIYVDNQLVAQDYENGNISGHYQGSPVTGTVAYDTGVINITNIQNVPPDARVLAKYYYQNEATDRIIRIGGRYERITVRAQSRKFVVEELLETIEGARAPANIDLLPTLVESATNDIMVEIDREIIQTLRQNAIGGYAEWNAVPPAGISLVEHTRDLVLAISTVSQQIFQKNKIGEANWILTSPKVAARLAALAGFRRIDNEDYTVTIGFSRMGLLESRWKVFVDPVFPENEILVGFNNPVNPFNAGCIYSPYIPMDVSQALVLPQITKVFHIRSRYAIRMVRPEFYGIVRVKNL